MDRWITYTKERFPIPVYLLLIGGFSLSGIFLSGGPFSWRSLLVSFFGFLLFFFQLRLMDERKDYDKDVIAHPDRPLPRGLLTTAEVDRTIVRITLLMLVYSALMVVMTNRIAGISYLAVTLYLLLMYKEFFIGAWLEERPLLYAASHQLIVFGVCIIAVTVKSPNLVLDLRTLSLGLAILGAFLGYEVSRKLDPDAHVALKTYLSIYGVVITSVIIAAASVIAALGAYGLGLQTLLWPAEGLLVASLLVLFFKPEKYKVVEGVATLSLLVHLWAVVIQHVTGWPK